uniref:RNA-dependent RNA polymerase n=1 Tax=Tasmanian devil-associated picobirnavirus 3 TaxID=2529455 RepID=A0A481W6A5_9VIRU|nr:MAG: RNA-dependent RNA polymerase [Tasmanian devil-associated picobirnavirus 3]
MKKKKSKESLKIGKINLNQFADLPNPGLMSYLSKTEQGNDAEYRTPFFKGKSLESVLLAWDKHLASIKSEMPELYAFEKDLGSKVGPLSIQKPLSERMDDIEAYYSSVEDDYTFEPIPASALNEVLAEWDLEHGGLIIQDQYSTWENMKKSTSSGLPWFTKKRVVSSSILDSKVWYSPENSETPMSVQFRSKREPQIKHTAAVLGWRGQEGGLDLDDVKQRVVWMFPGTANLQELRVYQPLIKHAQKHNLVPAWVSMEQVDAEITELFDSKNDDDLVICTDFTKFDQHFNVNCQNAALYLISHMFSGQQGALAKNLFNWLTSIFPIKYEIPLLIDPNHVVYGRHGMASGSGGTNADETIVHRALQYECAASTGQKLNPHSMCLGDDGIITFPGITTNDVIDTYTSHGLEMNTTKQYVSTHDCVYLRRWHGKDYRIDGKCVGVYSTNRALGRLMEQERYYDPDKWSKQMVALRQLSILENCKYHPLREEFVKFCMNGDKYRLGKDIPGFLDNIQSISKEAIELMPDFLGYTKALQKDDASQGIENWWIVQYLKSVK